MSASTIVHFFSNTSICIPLCLVYMQCQRKGSRCNFFQLSAEGGSVDRFCKMPPPIATRRHFLPFLLRSISPGLLSLKSLSLSPHFPCFSSGRSWGGKLRVCSRHPGIGCYRNCSFYGSPCSACQCPSPLSCWTLRCHAWPQHKWGPEWVKLNEKGRLSGEQCIQMRAIHLWAVWPAISELTSLGLSSSCTNWRLGLCCEV